MHAACGHPATSYACSAGMRSWCCACMRVAAPRLDGPARSNGRGRLLGTRQVGGVDGIQRLARQRLGQLSAHHTAPQRTVPPWHSRVTHAAVQQPDTLTPWGRPCRTWACMPCLSCLPCLTCRRHASPCKAHTHADAACLPACACLRGLPAALRIQRGPGLELPLDAQLHAGHKVASINRMAVCMGRLPRHAVRCGAQH